MGTRDIASARAIARTIIQRVVRDEAFASELGSRPRATLIAEGMGEWTRDDFIANDLGMEPEASGHLAAPCQAVTCNLLSCDVAWDRERPASSAFPEDPLARVRRRVIVKGVIQHALGDPAYAALLRADPRATLVDAGIAREAVDEVISHDLGMAVRASQYRFADWNQPDEV